MNRRYGGDNNNNEYNGSSGGGSEIEYNKNTYVPFLRNFIVNPLLGKTPQCCVFTIKLELFS
jgi:hypothetical protein